MYCPNCGSNNQAEVKFCTRCGTNLALVSDALSGNPSTAIQGDERTVKLLKDYYAGRRATLLGAVFLPIGFALLTVMFAMGFPEKAIMFAAIGLMIYGAIAGIAGISRWVDSSSEMKALGLTAPPRRSLPAPRELISSQPEIHLGLAEALTTDPIVPPASVTEQTTRTLDDRPLQPTSESRLTKN